MTVKHQIKQQIETGLKSLKRLLMPRNLDEDLRRRELILNILLGLSIFCFSFLNLIRLADVWSNPGDRGLPIVYTLLILAFFLFLFWLSRRGKIKTASWLLIIIYSLPMLYSFIFWGADLPAALLLATLIITLCGILIGERHVLISAAAINLFLIVLTYLQNNGIIIIHNYWRNERHEVGDAISYAILFLIIAGISWLFCHKLAKALNRARHSEAELRQERDSLEIKIIERTKELRRAEEEKINQLQRLAEFGRLSSGIFHDLVNPLTAVALNLEQIKEGAENKVTDAKSYLSQALLATRKMENLIISIKKQIKHEGNATKFSANEEIKQIIQILSYRARRAHARIIFFEVTEIELYGDAVKFGQIVSNLLTNALEAGESNKTDGANEREINKSEIKDPDTENKKSDINVKEKEIKISLTARTETKEIIITVNDRGCGIAPENLTKIFEPFFSTKKSNGQSLGIGLASVKNIVEKNFKGQIKVASALGQGTEFSVLLPTADMPTLSAEV